MLFILSLSDNSCDTRQARTDDYNFFAISLRVYGEGSYNSKLEYSTRVRKVSPTFGRAPQVLVTK